MATADPKYDPPLTGGGITLAAGTLAGRGSSSGTGTEEQITLGAGLALTGTVLDTTGGGGSGAGTNLSYVTISSEATLSAERVLTGSGRVSITDGGANSTVTLDLVDAGVTYAKIQDVAARSLVGRAANSSGVSAAISGGGAGTYASDNATTVAFRAVTDIIQNLNVSGDISPAQITANQNDYNPASLSTATVLRLDLDAARSITSIAGGVDGRVLILHNISAFTLTLTHDDGATGTAANRFDFGGTNVAVTTKMSVPLWYDSTVSRWKLVDRIAFTPANSTVTLTAGAGLTGGGDLSTNRTFDVVANADGTITVNANDIQVGTLVIGNFSNGLITDAKLANMGALSVKGRSANSSGVPADIQATAASGAVLRESGSTIGFGTVAAAGLASDSVTTVKILDANVTDAKLANMGARTVKGRSANSSGVPADIAGGGAATFLSDDASTLAFRVVSEIPQNFALSGDISPTQITSNQTDYNPTSLATSSTLRLDTDANRTINSLAGGADGRILTLHNIGSNPVTFLNDDGATGTAGNRFAFGFNVSLLPKRALVIQYDSTSSRWRRVTSEPEQVPQTLTDGATITWNLDNGKKAKVTLGGARTVAAPTGAKVDMMLILLDVYQDGTGSRTIAFTTGAGGFRATELSLSQTLSTAAGKLDRFLFQYSLTDDRWDLLDFRKAA